MVYEESFERVFGAVSLMCGDSHTAEEATQEAFARALERWDRLGNERWAVGWVMVTALNAALCFYRRRTWPLGRDAPGAEQATETVLDVRMAVSGLPRRAQQAVALYYLADLPVSEVARVMGCSVGAVKSHLSRGRAQLATDLGVQDDG